MSVREYVQAYREGRAAASVADAVNPYVPAAPGSRDRMLARLWLRGRLRDALDVPEDCE